MDGKALTYRSRFRLLFITPVLLSLAIVAPAFSASLFDQADTYFFDVKNNEAIPWGIVQVLLQDKEGFVWVGTQKGLMRFDGYHFKHYRPGNGEPDKLKGVSVLQLATDSRDRIWVGTDNGVSFFDKKLGRFFHLDDEVGNFPHERAIEILTRDEEVIIGTRKHLYLYRLSSERQHELIRVFDDGANVPGITTITFKDKITILVGTTHGLYSYNLAESVLTKIETAPDDQVNEIVIDSENTTWISMQNECLLYIDQNDQVRRVTDVKGREVMRQGRCFDIAEVSSRELWVSSFGEGIFSVDIKNRRLKKTIRADSLIEHSTKMDHVRDIMVDQNGLLWIALWGAGIQLHKIDNSYIRPLSLERYKIVPEDQLNIVDLERVRSGDLWLLGEQGAFILTLGASKLQTPKGLNELVKSTSTGYLSKLVLEKLANGHEMLYFSTTEGKLFSYDVTNQVAKHLALQHDGVCNAPYELLLSPSRQLWMTCRSGQKLVRYDLNTEQTTVIHFKEGLQSAFFADIALDPQDRLWVASTEGLFQLYPSNSIAPKQKFIEFFKGQNLTGLAINGNTLWLDGFSGLHRLDLLQENLEPENVSDLLGLPRDQVFGNMLFDGEGKIWSDEAMLNPHTLEFYQFSKADGFDFGPNWLSSASQEDNGNIALGSLNEVLLIQPQNFREKLSKSKTVITDIIIDTVPMDALVDKVTLDSDVESFSVDVSTLDYSAPQESRYQYRLEGYNQDWLETDADNRRISYTNLSSGTYQLWVKTSLRSKPWSEGEVLLTVIVTPAYYETWWFRTLLAIVVFGMVFLIVALRTRQLKKREKELEILVHSRTQELESSLDKLQVTQSQLVESEKQALLGRLVRGIAHRLNTPLGIILMGESTARAAQTAMVKLLHGSNIQPDIVSKTVKRGETAMDLINVNLAKAIDLVSFLKATTIESETAARPLRIHEFLSSIVTLHKFPIKLLGSEAVEVYCHSSELEQVVMELIKNANQHAAIDDPAIRVDFKLVEHEGVSTLEIAVTNQGSEIPLEIFDEIYEPFVSARSDGEASGLGLYMVHNIVTQRLNGEVTHQNNNGAVFIVRLPVKMREGSTAT